VFRLEWFFLDIEGPYCMDCKGDETSRDGGLSLFSLLRYVREIYKDKNRIRNYGREVIWNHMIILLCINNMSMNSWY